MHILICGRFTWQAQNHSSPSVQLCSNLPMRLLIWSWYWEVKESRNIGNFTSIWGLIQELQRHSWLFKIPEVTMVFKWSWFYLILLGVDLHEKGVSVTFQKCMILAYAKNVLNNVGTFNLFIQLWHIFYIFKYYVNIAENYQNNPS